MGELRTHSGTQALAHPATAVSPAPEGFSDTKLIAFDSRDLGPLREGRIYFHPLEREWITNLYKTYEADSKSSGKEPDYKSMPWDALTKDFNDTFEGRTLDDQTGKRPHRSKPSIMTERYRIPEVCRISGLKPKAGGKQKEKSDDEAAEDEDGGNAGDGKGKGKTPNKRGSKKG